MSAAKNSRRAFLATCAGAALARAAEPLRIIDTHTHFYDPSRPQGVPWPAKGTPLYRTVLPSDYKVLAKPHDIAGTVVVEASPWVEDNQWLLDLAEREPFIKGIVGNLDPLDAQFSANLARFAKNPLFRGIRVNGSKLIEHGTAPTFLAAMRQLADANLSLDLNGGAYLPFVPSLTKAVPSLRIVIDHVGGAGDAASLTAAWRDGIRAAGESANVFCKVSALPEQTRTAPGQAPTDTAYYLPILDAVWEAFGADRVVYGSNWPVSDKGTNFANTLRIVREYFAAKGPEAEAKYFRDNSRRAYRWLNRW